MPHQSWSHPMRIMNCVTKSVTKVHKKIQEFRKSTVYTTVDNWKYIGQKRTQELTRKTQELTGEHDFSQEHKSWQKNTGVDKTTQEMTSQSAHVK